MKPTLYGVSVTTDGHALSAIVTILKEEEAYGALLHLIFHHLGGGHTGSVPLVLRREQPAVIHQTDPEVLRQSLCIT